MNHVKYEERLGFVKGLMKDKFGIEPITIEPLEYDAECPFAFNNFVYLLTLSCSPNPPTPAFTIQQPTQPYTTPLPTSLTSLVIRLPNPLSELDHTNRIENEVIAMSLFREALKPKGFQRLIPEVYGWCGCKEGGEGGWILMEYKNGIVIYDRDLHKYTDAQHRHIFSQFAQMYPSIQSIQLPDGFDYFGGSTIDKVNGEIVGGKMTLPYGGPFESYLDLWKGTVRAQLVDADKSPVVQGWHANGLRERIDRFVSSPSGLEAVVASIPHTPGEKKRHLLHGDFTIANCLFDKETLDMTAILDFDWVYISGHLGEEYLRSLGTSFYVPPAPPTPSSTSSNDDINNTFDAFLREAILTGNFPSSFPSSLSPPPTEKEIHRYNISKIFHEALGQHGIKRPFEMEGFRELENLWRWKDGLAPFEICASFRIKWLGGEKCEKKRGEGERMLGEWLEGVGF